MARVPQVLIGKAPSMSVYMYSYSVEGPLISSQFLNVVIISQAVRFEDVRAGLPLRSSFREISWVWLHHPCAASQWLLCTKEQLPSLLYRKLLQTLTWLRHWGAGFLGYVLTWTFTRWQQGSTGGYLVAREAGSISRSKQNLYKPFHG